MSIRDSIIRRVSRKFADDRACTLNGSDRGANNARNERERRSVLAGLIPTRGGIALRTNEIIYSTRTKSATLGGADNDQRAETAQRKGRSFDTFALQSSKIQSGGWSLPATPTRRVGQKWDTSVSENRAFLSAILDRGACLSGNLLGTFLPFSREEAGLREQRQTVFLIPARYPPDDLNPSCRLIPYFSEIHSRLMRSLNHSRSLCRISRFAERKCTHAGKEVRE